MSTGRKVASSKLPMSTTSQTSATKRKPPPTTSEPTVAPKRTPPAISEMIVTPNTVNAEAAEKVLADLDAAINESIARSPRPLLDIDEPSTSATTSNFEAQARAETEAEAEAEAEAEIAAMEVDINRADVVFVRPPTLNQISGTTDNVRDIQRAIDMIKAYMDTLQNNIAPAKISTKDHFTIFERQTNKLAYKDIIFSILNNNTVNRRNFVAVSDMFYYYYIKLFDNILPIAHIIVNVNYTRNKTKITHMLTAFLNSCAHYVVSNIKQLFNVEQKNINVPEDYYRIIDSNQSTLTNLYNFRLSDLRSVLFVKHTPDNDVNKFEIVRAANPDERVIDVPIHVLMNVPRLRFE